MHDRDDDAADELVIERHFDAPIDLVWRMWTEPEHFKAWYGPSGATIPTADFDLRVGGARRVHMSVETPDGPMQMWFAGEHLEVVDRERLVYTEFIADEQGRPTAGPDGAMHETEVRVEFEPAGNGTIMRMTHVGIPADSPGAMGWTMAFDKLAPYVEAQARL